MTILERETEIGKCDADTVASMPPSGGVQDCIVCAYTLASLTGSKHMLKVEHRCYIRSGTELFEQSLLKPELNLEPVFGSEQEMLQFAQTLHQQFMDKVRAEYPLACPFGTEEQPLIQS